MQTDADSGCIIDDMYMTVQGACDIYVVVRALFARHRPKWKYLDTVLVLLESQCSNV